MDQKHEPLTDQKRDKCMDPVEFLVMLTDGASDDATTTAKSWIIRKALTELLALRKVVVAVESALDQAYEAHSTEIFQPVTREQMMGNGPVVAQGIRHWVKLVREDMRKAKENTQ